MLGPRGAGHHPPSVPVRTPPGQLRRAEHLALLIAEEGHVAGRFDLLPQAVRQAARLEDDVAELPGREEAVQLTVPYGMISGWSSYEDGMSSRAQDVR